MLELPCLDRKSIKRALCHSLCVSYNENCRKRFSRELGNDHLTHLRLRLSRWGGFTDVILSHFILLPSHTPGFLVTLYIKILCNALNTDGDRRRHFDPHGSRHPDKCVTNLTPCYLCGLGSNCKGDTGDSCFHLFFNCLVVKEALRLVLEHVDFPDDPELGGFLRDKKTPFFITDFPPADIKLGFSRLLFVMSFSWAVCRATEQVRQGRTNVEVDVRILALTLSLKNLWTPKKKKPTKYGSGKSRSSLQKVAALSDSVSLLTRFPDYACVVSVSGSCETPLVQRALVRSSLSDWKGLRPRLTSSLRT